MRNLLGMTVILALASAAFASGNMRVNCIDISTHQVIKSYIAKDVSFIPSISDVSITLSSDGSAFNLNNSTMHNANYVVCHVSPVSE